MKLLTGLFRAARKRLMTTDNDMGMFRKKLDELVASKDTLSNEEIVTKVDELKGFTNDLPEESKNELDRYFEDFKSVKEMDPAVVKEASEMLADKFEQLDTEAMKDVPTVEEPAPAEETPAEEPLVEGAAPEEAAEDGDVSTEEIAEETEVPEGDDEAEDAEPGANAEYTAEELYQFMKSRLLEDKEVLEFLRQRMSEDAACQDAAAEEVDQEEKKEEDEVVTDHAIPRIPVTMNNSNATKGTLAQMFAEAKGAR